MTRNRPNFNVAASDCDTPKRRRRAKDSNDSDYEFKLPIYRAQNCLYDVHPNLTSAKMNSLQH